jgi:hypothetical protein
MMLPEIFPDGVLRALLVGAAMAIPIPFLWRSKKRLTWATAVMVGIYLTGLAIVLLGDVHSRILYWFDQEHTPLAERFTFLAFWEEDLGGNPGYQVVADIVSNTVAGIFFIAFCAGAYFWGEKQKREGRF